MRRCLYIGVLCLLPVFAAGAQAEYAKAAAVDAAVAEWMAEEGIAGCAVGVIEDGAVAYLKAYGHDKQCGKVPLTLDSMFRWASVSKPVTAVAALQLWEAGKLDLDADVREYVPEFPDKGAKITMRQLLGNLGGIVHYTNGPVIRTQAEYATPHPYADVVLALDTFKESPLVSQPGEKNNYSTHGFILASAVVQRAGGESFVEQVYARISAPAGITTLQPDYQWVDIPNRVRGCRKMGGLVVPSWNADVSWKLGGGGFISTIGDMARFCRGLANGGFLGAEAQALMFTQQQTADGKGTGYGMGVSVRGSGDTLRISHGGAQEKTRTQLTAWPAQKRGIVVMSNSEWSKPANAANAIEKALWAE